MEVLCNEGGKEEHVTCIEAEVSQPQKTGGLPSRSSRGLGGFMLIQSLALNSAGSAIYVSAPGADL